MAINKVVLNGDTKIDLTNDTVTPETLMSGYTAHDRSGAMIIGTATAGSHRGVAVVFGDSIFNNTSASSEFGDYLEDQGIYSEVRNFAKWGSGFGETYGGTSDIEYSLYNMLKVSSNPHYTAARQAVRDAEIIYLHLGGNDCLAAIEDGEFDMAFLQKCKDVFAEIFSLNSAVLVKFVDFIPDASMLTSKPIIDYYGANGAGIFATTRMFVRNAIANANSNIKIADISSFGSSRVLQSDGLHPTHDAALNIFDGVVYGGYADTGKIVDALIVYVYGGVPYSSSAMNSMYIQLLQNRMLNTSTKLIVYYDSPERVVCYNMLYMDQGQMIWQGDIGKKIRFNSSGFAFVQEA